MDTKDNVDALRFSFKTDEEIEKFLADDEDDANQDNNNNQPSDRLIGYIKEGDFDNRKGSFAEKFFKKFEAGSVRASIFNMTILSLGSACLNLPKNMADMSLIMGLIAIVFTALSTYWTLYILGRTCEKYRIFNYSKLTRLILGNAMGVVLDVFVFIYIYGILIMYQVVIYKMLGEVVYNFGRYDKLYSGMNAFLTESFWSYTSFKLSIMYGITLFIILPLCLFKDISKLRIVSILGVLTLILIIILIIAESPSYIQHYWKNVYKEDDPSTHLNIFNFYSSFDSNFYFFQGTASLFYSFTCHLGAFPIFNSLKNNVMIRINKVIIRTILLDCFFFFMISILGYLTWPINPPSLIIEREKLSDGMDITMNIARLSLGIIVISKLPNSYNAFRISMFELLLGDSKITNKRNWLLAVPILCSAVLIGILYDQITGYIRLLGGFCSTFIAYVMPGIIYIKTNDYHWYHWKNVATLVLIMVLATIGFSSGIITLIKIIHGKK